MKLKTWALITARFLFLMVGGTDQFYKRIPRAAGGSFSLPASWWDSPGHEPPGSVVVDLERSDPAMWVPSSPGDSTPGTLTPPRQTPATLFIYRPEKKDRFGLFEFTLLAVSGSESKTWTVFSGSPSAQVIVRPEDDRAGSNRPVPHGLYSVGGVERKAGGWGPGLGPVWVSLVEFRPRHRRSAIGLHQDSNATTARGSAGCVVHPDLQVVEDICRWIQAYKPKYLVVDYGFGLEAELRAAGLV